MNEKKIIANQKIKNNIKEKIMNNTKNQKQYNFPSEEETEKMVKEMTRLGYRRVNQVLLPNADTEDKIKYELCQSIIRYARKNKLTEKQLGEKLRIDHIEIEYILFSHFNKLTLKRLISYVDSLGISPFEANHGQRATA
jgi:predicted XRE-type DNA-binding protein